MVELAAHIRGWRFSRWPAVVWSRAGGYENNKWNSPIPPIGTEMFLTAHGERIAF
jgi:hypothetical protein